MHLKLAVAGTVIASIPLDANLAKNASYLHTKRLLLTSTCNAIISQLKEPPVYYIEAASKMNQRRASKA